MARTLTYVCRVAAAGLILAAAALRVLYLASDCALDLSPDEAHYWDWSRRLDWSYYSKGPLVAGLIRLSCELFGGWSVALTGTEMLAVRLPAIVCGSLLLVSLYVLTAQVFRREGLALALVGLALTVPALAAGSTLMTIDAPYLCCWGWALVLGHRAIFRESLLSWLGAGLLVGLGILAKYTMVLWPVSLGLFLLTTPGRRHLLKRRGFWIMASVAAIIGALPILAWNATHDWVTLRHSAAHAGFRRLDFHWPGPLAFVGKQLGLLMGYWFVVWLFAMSANRPWRRPVLGKGDDKSEAVAYLWWMSAPVFLVFGLFSFKNGGGEPNWPAAAYLSGAVLAAAWLASQLRSSNARYRWATLIAFTLFLAVNLGATLLLHFPVHAQPVLLSIAGTSPERAMPLRRLDPTCRLRGWHALATEVDQLRERLRSQGSEPVLAGTSWTIPGELAFYCEGCPVVYSLGIALGDRRSQYDLWRPNPIADPEAFAGRTFIVVLAGDSGVAGTLRDLGEAFAELEPARPFTYSEGGHAVAGWTIVVGHGFRGLPPADAERLRH